ncbi:2-deoxyglucose-6-phosphate phosphatase 2 [Eremomyces bilateralis CBS 781.70]|uniref:2-deoxyglucose-6-phosphate phosphatase 2 n=1 Tax=Eremomyces bilateralis CBS 781.70 TaxID=1392243 RepID=A0A6G1GGV9_9PEZI|nr:2-deoxyglucose-6-phosphate phosphatase 2 [Eremomyces bilateralis CBS 781.70]KAF1817283.1 2-deoxyglucose-6-phosphate phosphatase 2 [Eremomyces bilateralis CBS 781.70]
MDGTIIDSTPAIVQHWHKIGKELGIDPNVILETSHGRRSIDVLRIYDESKANWEYITHAEAQIPLLYGSSAVEIPGSRALLETLESVAAPWAIITSGTKPLVTGWLDVLRLAHPRCLVTAEDVAEGKPSPEGYAMAARSLGLRRDGGEGVLVLEDAAAGVRAGKAAGFKVVALATTHTVEQLVQAGADWVVQDMRSVRFLGYGPEKGVVTVEIRDALR